MPYTLLDTELLKLKVEKEKENNEATFVLEPLQPGFGHTIGNALRRVLLSSLSGAAITKIKIEGADHEFSTLSGMKEDTVELILNLKGLRLKYDGDLPTTLVLDVKGPKEVRAGLFKTNPEVSIVDPDYHLATLASKGHLKLEATVEKGIGYLPVEMRSEEKNPIGTMAIDALFSPIKLVNTKVENTRVGRITNYDKIILEVKTDGTISPQDAFKKAAGILSEHTNLVLELTNAITETPKAKGEVRKAKLKITKVARKISK